MITNHNRALTASVIRAKYNIRQLINLCYFYRTLMKEENPSVNDSDWMPVTHTHTLSLHICMLVNDIIHTHTILLILMRDRISVGYLGKHSCMLHWLLHLGDTAFCASMPWERHRRPPPPQPMQAMQVQAHLQQSHSNRAESVR